MLLVEENDIIGEILHTIFERDIDLGEKAIDTSLEGRQQRTLKCISKRFGKSRFDSLFDGIFCGLLKFLRDDRQDFVVHQISNMRG